MAQMESAIDYTKKFGAWAQDKWSGTFAIRWIIVKDLPNSQFRHILLANNENKPVTNSRDTQARSLTSWRLLDPPRASSSPPPPLSSSPPLSCHTAPTPPRLRRRS